MAPPDHATAALEVESISVSYGDIRALWDVSLQVQPGQIAVMLGRNGAGKTTTLSAVAGLLAIRGGAVRLGGRDLTRVRAPMRTRLGLGLVQEGKRIFRRRSVYENLVLGGFWKFGRRDLAREIDLVMDRFPILAERRHRPAASLSGGEQQMLAIAQVLIAKPAVVMLDEPSAGLAPEIVQRVLDIIVGLKREGLAVLLVEQLVHQALSIADHVYVLELGRIVLSRPASELSSTAEIENVYLGAV